MDYWIEPVNKPKLTKADKGFDGVAHCGDVTWPNYAKRQKQWEANAKRIVAAVNFCEGFDNETLANMKNLKEELMFQYRSGHCGALNMKPPERSITPPKEEK